MGFGLCWEGCQRAFLLIWPIRKLKHRELKRPARGHTAGQRQSRGSSPGSLCKFPTPGAPTALPHRAQLCCGGSSIMDLPCCLCMHSTFGTGPLVIKVPRDRKAGLKQSWKHKKENKTTVLTGASPGESTGVQLKAWPHPRAQEVTLGPPSGFQSPQDQANCQRYY